MKVFIFLFTSIYVSEPWACFIGSSKRELVYDISLIDDKVYFCGRMESFNSEDRAFIRCFSGGVLKWCRLIEKGVSARKLYFIDNELATCGENFLGFLTQR